MDLILPKKHYSYMALYNTHHHCLPLLQLSVMERSSWWSNARCAALIIVIPCRCKISLMLPIHLLTIMEEIIE
jgi:hypothetical protein